MTDRLPLLQAKHRPPVDEALHELVVELAKEDSSSRLLLVVQLLRKLHYYVLLLSRGHLPLMNGYLPARLLLLRHELAVLRSDTVVLLEIALAAAGSPGAASVVLRGENEIGRRLQVTVLELRWLLPFLLGFLIEVNCLLHCAVHSYELLLLY